MKESRTNVGLNKQMRILRDRLHGAINALDMLERLDLAGAWGVSQGENKREAALRTINTCVASIAEYTKDGRREQQRVNDLLLRQQQEIERLQGELANARGHTDG